MKTRVRHKPHSSTENKVELSLETMILKRDFDFLAFTNKIMSTYDKNLREAVRMFYKIDRDVEWQRLDRLNEIPGYLVIIGKFLVSIGDVVVKNGVEVIVDRENIHEAVPQIRLVLHANIVQNGTPKAIHQHMQFVQSLSASGITEAELVKVLNSGATTDMPTVENPAVNSIIEKITRPALVDSFDATALTEDQYNVLRLQQNATTTLN